MTGARAVAVVAALVGAAEPPVRPDGPTAQRWAREELLDPVYHQQQSLLSRFLSWLGHLFSGMHGAALPPRGALLAAAVGLAVLVVAGLWVTGPVRRSRRTRPEAVLAAADGRTAAELRAAADAAAVAGDFSTAVAERFRSLARGLEERAVLDERPGRTADEVARDAGEVLSAVATDLLRAGRLFDDVVYGGRTARRADDDELRATDDAVRAARRTVSAGHAAEDAP
ncbi:MAG: hypothetical protein BGO38_13085 [Cellulomonas sp. 73-145]|uniref:DUF4129 domain-containing protein n=1 Tax=unclassified Cellulomonas TaxID=2620175 RepID=UPI00092C5394|nr:DUF4129 domain-containing protein [Cellulomonas sp. 73-145]OJV59713.1 MAG: hypothetical protein BGO38_13085 [Cellulomonas sp. 73-145]